ELYLDADQQEVGGKDAEGNQFRAVLDPAGQVVKRFDALQQEEDSAYDAVGRMTSMTSANGLRTVQQFDAGDRLVSVTYKSAGRVTLSWQRATFDNNDNQLTLTDAAGTYTSTFDAFNRMVTRTDPLGGVETWTYDKAGRQTGYDDQLGRHTTYLYDNVGN